MTEEILLKYQLEAEVYFQEQGFEVLKIDYNIWPFKHYYISILLVEGSRFYISKGIDKMIGSCLTHIWTLCYKDAHGNTYYINGKLHELIIKRYELCRMN